MKIGRYVLAALIVVIVAFVIQRLSRHSPVEVPSTPDSMESPAGQVSNAAAKPLSPAKQPSVATDTTTAHNPTISNAPRQVRVATENRSPAEIISTPKIESGAPAAPPAPAQFNFSKGPPPPTPAPPPPAELFRTNMPEKLPREGGASPRP